MSLVCSVVAGCMTHLSLVLRHGSSSTCGFVVGDLKCGFVALGGIVV
jgi:hypothetical protein